MDPGWAFIRRAPRRTFIRRAQARAQVFMQQTPSGLAYDGSQLNFYEAGPSWAFIQRVQPGPQSVGSNKVVFYGGPVGPSVCWPRRFFTSGQRPGPLSTYTKVIGGLTYVEPQLGFCTLGLAGL